MISFDIALRDLPRAARVLIRLAVKKKRNNNLVSTSWAASPIYDFKGTLENVLELRTFPGEISVPINTTLSNVNDPKAGQVSIVLAPDLTLYSESSARRLKIVHSIPARLTPVEGDNSELSPEQLARLKSILLISFNPMSMSILNDDDKSFVWNLRYNILNRAELLPVQRVSTENFYFDYSSYIIAGFCDECKME
jgi:hypothetical protein